MIDTKLLHSRITASAPEFLRELFGEEVKRAGTDKWRVGRRGSLAIGIKDGGLVFYSHEDGTGGDAVALWQRQRGGSVGEALKAAAAWADVPDKDSPRRRERRPSGPRSVKREPKPETAKPEASLRMTWEQFEQAHVMIKRLGTDPGLCERIAKARGWKAETIWELCGHGVIGWSDGWTGHHSGALAFMYYSGIKQRWLNGTERMIRWFCGGPRLFWRAFLVHPGIKTIFITEGETDAISLIDAGVETAGDALVVALPNAGVVPHGIEELVTGRKVVLSLDDDRAGRAATEKLIPLIKPIAASLIKWKPTK